MEIAEWRQAQENDPVSCAVFSFLRRVRGPDTAERAMLSPETLQIWREKDRQEVKERVLYRRVSQSRSLKTAYHLILLAALRSKVWQVCHLQADHLGAEKTLVIIRKRFFWVKQVEDVQAWCTACVRAPLAPITIRFPLELLAMYAQVLTDHCTKYVWAIPMQDQTASSTAKALWQNVIRFFGGP